MLLNETTLTQLRNNFWGHWLSAKIYPDTRANCPCGGLFTGRNSVDDLEYPVCGTCGKRPEKMRIRAKIITPSHEVQYIDIRHDRKNDPFKTTAQILLTLETVKVELSNGTFDARNYESKKKRERFLFLNVRELYVSHFQDKFNKGEITFYGLKGKKKNSKILLAYFGNKNVNAIDKRMVDQYKIDFKGPPSNLRESVNELKTILRWAYNEKFVQSLPAFEGMKSNKRTEIPNLQITREKIIPHIEDATIQIAIRTLVEHGLRPCEVRAATLSNVMPELGKIAYDHHFSGPMRIPGRKSNPDGKYSILKKNLFKALHEHYLKRISEGAKPEDPLFFKNGFLSETAIQKEWRKTLEKLGLKHVQLYGVRHARGSEVLNSTDGNIMETKEFMGHSEVKTTLDRYASYNLKFADRYSHEEQMAEVLELKKKES